MKCKDCDACVKGWFSSNEYVCIGVKEPFVIYDIDAHCTEYEDISKITAKEYVCKNFSNEEILEKIISASPNYCCIGEFGIATEYSLSKCNRDCEECWNSNVEKLL